MESIYHIETDLECRVFHFGKEICLAIPGEDVSIMLKKGRHKLSFISTENSSDQYSIVHEVPENDIEDYISIILTPLRESRLKKEDDDRKIALETKQRLLREEKEKEAIRRKHIEDEARKIREKEEREKAQAEAEERERKEKERLWREREHRFQQFVKARDEYNQYVIKSIPNKNDGVIYLELKYRPTCGLPVFEPFLGVKTIGAPSRVFPAIKCSKRMVQIGAEELIRHFANDSFYTIKRLRYPYEGITAFNFKTLENQRAYKELKRLKKRDELISMSKTHQFDASSYAKFYYESKQIINRSRFTTSEGRSVLWIQNESFVDNSKATIEFLLSKMADSNKWRDFFYKLFDDSFNWSQDVYRSLVLELMDTSRNDTIECECNDYRLVYIDEACNEIVDATDNMMVSNVKNGIMIWANHSTVDNTIVYSVRSFHGNELFSINYKEPNEWRNALFLPGRERNGLIFSLRCFTKEGRICLSDPSREFWLSGIINELPPSTHSKKILGTDIKFINPCERINYLPQMPFCYLINGKYYISSYQGFIEIEKPNDWHE